MTTLLDRIEGPPTVAPAAAADLADWALELAGTR